MLVPETAVKEDDLFTGRKHEVRLAGQIPPVQSEAVAHSMDQPSQRQFRRGVLRPDLPHVLTAAVLVELIQGGYLRLR